MALLLFFSQQISSPRVLRDDVIAPAPMDAENSLLLPPHRKGKVVFVLGATGTGKSKLAITLATHFDGEVVNSDKMQVYSGLDVVTNKVTEAEAAHIPHHLLGGVHPDADFTAADFRREATRAVASIVARGRLPIVAGGSNSYIEALVDGEDGEFRRRYDCCFLWVDVDLPVLHKFVASRVDKMVQQGLIDEARSVFDPNNGDYTRGVRRSIGVPELDRYFHGEAEAAADELERLRAAAIEEIKVNTCKLTVCQLLKIHRLCRLEGWDVSRIDATEFFLIKRPGDASEEKVVWEKIVGIPSTNIVRAFLERGDDHHRVNNDKLNHDNNKNNNNNCTVLLLHGNGNGDLLEKDENTKNSTGGDDDHENVYYVGDKNKAVEVMVEKAVLLAAAAAAAAAAADEVSDVDGAETATATAAAAVTAATATAGAGATTV